MNGGFPEFAAWMALKRQAPEFPAGGGVVANPGLVPPGYVVWEDGSWSAPPPFPDPAAVEMLPGLFGHGGAATFVPER